ncbi:hypothetical protein Tco_0079766 [Tanacetum coccineum]
MEKTAKRYTIIFSNTCSTPLQTITKKRKKERRKEDNAFKPLSSLSVRKTPVLFLALGWHLEEIHVTWAHLEKKRTRLQTYTKFMKKYCLQSVETASCAYSVLVKSDTPDRELIITRVLVMSWPDMPYLLY